MIHHHHHHHYQAPAAAQDQHQHQPHQQAHLPPQVAQPAAAGPGCSLSRCREAAAWSRCASRGASASQRHLHVAMRSWRASPRASGLGTSHGSPALPARGGSTGWSVELGSCINNGQQRSIKLGQERPFLINTTDKRSELVAAPPTLPPGVTHVSTITSTLCACVWLVSRSSTAWRATHGGCSRQQGGEESVVRSALASCACLVGCDTHEWRRRQQPTVTRCTWPVFFLLLVACMCNIYATLQVCRWFCRFGQYAAQLQSPTSSMPFAFATESYSAQRVESGQRVAHISHQANSLLLLVVQPQNRLILQQQLIASIPPPTHLPTSTTNMLHLASTASYLPPMQAAQGLGSSATRAVQPAA